MNIETKTSSKGDNPPPINPKKEIKVMDKSSGLTKKEREVMDSLVEAFNLFTSLPIQHVDDIKEFAQHTHILQRMVSVRIARRDYPDYWTNEQHV